MESACKRGSLSGWCGSDDKVVVDDLEGPKLSPLEEEDEYFKAMRTVNSWTGAEGSSSGEWQERALACKINYENSNRIPLQSIFTCISLPCT